MDVPNEVMDSPLDGIVIATRAPIRGKWSIQSVTESHSRAPIPTRLIQTARFKARRHQQNVRSGIQPVGERDVEPHPAPRSVLVMRFQSLRFHEKARQSAADDRTPSTSAAVISVMSAVV